MSGNAAQIAKVQSILQGLKDRDLSARGKAAHMVTTLSILRDPTAEEDILGDNLENLVTSLVLLLRSDDTKLQTKAARALAWISWDYGASDIVMIEAFRLLASLLMSSDRELQIEVCSALTALASSGEENAAEIGNSQGVVRNLISLLNINHPKLQRDALCVLAALSRSSKVRAVVMGPEYSAQFTKELNVLLSSKSQEIQRLALRNIGCYASGDRSNSATLSRLMDVISSLKRSTNSVIVCEAEWAQVEITKMLEAEPKRGRTHNGNNKTTSNVPPTIVI